jgi:cell division septation protein DedD
VSGNRFLVAAAVALGLAAAPAPAGAQTDPRLAAAVRAAQEGQGDSARAGVERLLAATPTSDTLYPQILYTQAMVATSAGDMRRLLQRITVEYATSDWADDALLRLVQMDYATRNLDGAARNLERLRLDFPASPLMAQAAYWAGRTYFDNNQPQAACRWLADGMAQTRSDVELQNQLGFLYQRCDLRPDSGAAAAAGDSARRDSTGALAARDTTARDTAAGARPAPPTSSVAPGPPSPAAPPTAATPSGGAAGPGGAASAPARTVYRVQIAAVGSKKAADEAAKRARPLGLTVMTTRQGSLYKVRIGEYATREAAQTAASSLKAKLGGSPFVVSEP